VCIARRHFQRLSFVTRSHPSAVSGRRCLKTVIGTLLHMHCRAEAFAPPQPSRWNLGCKSRFVLKKEAIMPLNRAEIVRALGEVDDVIVAQIVASDATVADLAEAQAWVLNDEPLLNRGKPLPAGRVGQLAKILSKLEEERAEPVVPPK
jgi:hypothetical protein